MEVAIEHRHQVRRNGRHLTHVVPATLQGDDRDGRTLNLKRRCGERENFAQARASPCEGQDKELFCWGQSCCRSQDTPSLRSVEVLSRAGGSVKTDVLRKIRFHRGLRARRLQPSCAFCFSRCLTPANEAIFTFRFSDAKELN